jgi:hypothetical protein
MARPWSVLHFDGRVIVGATAASLLKYRASAVAM